MSQLSDLKSFLLPALSALPLLVTACGGGGGGGSSTTLGAFGVAGEVVALDPGDMRATVAARGALGHSVHGFARDASRDLLYTIDAERNALLRIDSRGRVEQVGILRIVPGPMVHDRLSGMLIGVKDNGLFDPSELIRIDPATAEAVVVASTSRVRNLALDSSMNRLLAVATTSSGSASNHLISIDPATGATQPLFDHLSFPTLTGMTFDPFTRLLYGVDNGAHASLLSFDLGSQLIQDAVFFDRPLAEVALDDDTGRFYSLSTGGEVLALTTETQAGEAEVLVTLERELTGVTFDPADGRFFAIDARNHELVKVDARSGSVAPIAYFSPRSAGQVRDLRSMAYDPGRNTLFSIERSEGEFLSIDPRTAQCSEIGLTASIDMILAIDQQSGRIFGFDQAVDVVVEIDPEAPAKHILDNNTGLTKVTDLVYEPSTQRLVALHETPGRDGVPMISSIQLVGPFTNPAGELGVPFGLTGFDRDSRTGLYYGFGPGHPRYEFELDLVSGSTLDSSARSLDGAWSRRFRAALSVPSRGVVYAIDQEVLYAWNAGTRSMRRLGPLPSGFTVTDLIFDSGTGDLGLRHGGAIIWVNPTIPFSPKGANAPISGRSDLRLTGDPSNGRLFGVVDGALHLLTLGSTATTLVTQTPRPGFTAESIVYSPAHGAVFAMGSVSSDSTRPVVRFDVLTGDWADVGSVDGALQALFLN
ncbi:MAG: hypothetical protein HOP15_09485 [Planctomycetes bacterium]|nr:hypothetical protein [Planctomycetota bacterium]